MLCSLCLTCVDASAGPQLWGTRRDLPAGRVRGGVQRWWRDAVVWPHDRVNRRTTQGPALVHEAAGASPCRMNTMNCGSGLEMSWLQSAAAVTMPAAISSVEGRRYSRLQQHSGSLAS